MATLPESGFNLQADLVTLWTDTALHDVTLVCTDGVEFTACRALLASRSPVFRAMFFGSMRESTTNSATFGDVRSHAMNAVLEFIHTDDIKEMTPTATVEVYRVAEFFLLPKLKAMALERAREVKDLAVATGLLNDAVRAVPWGEGSTDLYDVLLKPFCEHNLTVGALNELSQKALEFLLTRTKNMEFGTSEYDLLLCVVEWAWSRVEDAPPFGQRLIIFDLVTSMPADPDMIIPFGDGSARACFLAIISHINLSLVCPHRLKCLVEAVDALADVPSHYLVFCQHACKNTKCPTGHPSEFRKELGPRWDCRMLSPELVVSEGGTVIAFPAQPSTTWVAKTAKVTGLPADWTTQDGVIEWDVVFETVGSWRGEDYTEIHLVALKEVDGEVAERAVNAPTWKFRSWGKRNYLVTGEEMSYGDRIRNGDVVTFHWDTRRRTCSFSINGTNYGVAWRNLPANIQFTVTLCPQAKCRVRAFFGDEGAGMSVSNASITTL